MAFNIRLYSEFTKRENSTKRAPVPAEGEPEPEGSIRVAITLKDPCSLLRPTILLAPAAFPALTDTPVGYNYAYIPEFGDRFYWITDWRWSNGIWEADLVEDVLASWRASIGASTQYILRSSHSHNGDIEDGLYPTKAGIRMSTEAAASPWAGAFDTGSYVVGIINDDDKGTGAVNYYVFTKSEFKDLLNYLLRSSEWLDIQDISENLTKALFNPLQYITSIMWFPFEVPTAEDDVSALKFGWWTLDVACSRMDVAGVKFGSTELSVPKHPQANSRGTYLNLPPYTRYSLNFAPFGMFPVDPAPFINVSRLYALWRVDCVTGEGTLCISPTNNYENVVDMRTAMVGVPIQLAQIYRDLAGTASSAVSTASSVAGGIGQAISGAVTGFAAGGFGGALAGAAGGLIGSAGSVASGIYSTIEHSMPQMQSVGSQGSISALGIKPFLYSQHFPLVDEDNEDRGRPLCAVRQISSIPGYILVADPDVEIRGTAEESTIIKAYMAGGFFYE